VGQPALSGYQPSFLDELSQDRAGDLLGRAPSADIRGPEPAVREGERHGRLDLAGGPGGSVIVFGSAQMVQQHGA